MTADARRAAAIAAAVTAAPPLPDNAAELLRALARRQVTS
jgi:hypothetical protein